ncbi:hypothetical protein TNCT_237531 [Trichonephila clavata]|uniref:Peptidase aspartic putative domain-containing protein n=1 Tax=Trichonephila clavata TaxID=2740835 RepID=A0A8X6FMX1_TRICU|nr:hypothetical protein TNCT_237531 [Trichonephila clavata]
MSKEILVALNRKRGSVKAQLTRRKDFINNPDEKDKIKVALCKSSRNCHNCSKWHNSLLCRNFERKFDSQRSQISETLSTLESKLNVNSECFKPKQTIPSFDTEGVEFVGHAKGHSTGVLSTAIVYCQNNRGELFPLRTLLDCGSQSNLISQDAVLALGLQGERVNTSICGINGTSQMIKKESVCRGFE